MDGRPGHRRTLIAIVALVAGAPSVLAALGRTSGESPASSYDRLVNAIAQRQWLSVHDADGGTPHRPPRTVPSVAIPRLRAFVNQRLLPEKRSAGSRDLAAQRRWPMG
ncbi:hypothetical protein ACRAWD_27385 [Caulobacter segnis]